MNVTAGGGARLHYETAGNGPAVVFSHGVLMDSGMWRPQVDVFSSRFTCVTWDERGHGRTVMPDAPFDYWDSARDLLTILDDAGVAQAVLVGHSQGGFLSLRAALLAPERVTGLVLAPAHAQALDGGTQDAFRGIKAAWLDHGPAPVRDALLGMLVGDPQFYPQLSQSWEHLERTSIGRAFDALIALDDIGSQVKSIESPALVIHGGADPAMPVDIGRDLHNRLGNGVSFEIIPGAGHAPSLTHPDEFNALLGKFLDAYAGGR